MATKTLYVGNFPYSASASDLQDHFAAYNPTNPRLIEGRGFCFIDIDADHLAAAIAEKNDKDFQGRNLTVNEAQPRGTSRGGDQDSRGGNRGGRW
jgi:cold-inducible RNA-binding protein